jgi:hypothetical protein
MELRAMGYGSRYPYGPAWRRVGINLLTPSLN